MTRRRPGSVAIAAALIVLSLGAWGCSGGGADDASDVPRGELPADGEAVMYEFYTDS